jgi:hypothetical protein
MFWAVSYPAYDGRLLMVVRMNQYAGAALTAIYQLCFLRSLLRLTKVQVQGLKTEERQWARFGAT